MYQPEDWQQFWQIEYLEFNQKPCPILLPLNGEKSIRQMATPQQILGPGHNTDQGWGLLKLCSLISP